MAWNTTKDAGNSYENPMLSWLDKVNDNLEANPFIITEFLDQISSEGEALSQSAVDVICEWSSCKANREIERLRQKVIKGLYKQNKVITVIVAPAQALYNFYKNPLGAIEGAIKMIVSILGVLYAPVMAFVEFMSDLAKELSRLARNLAVIASSLPPKSPNPKINFNKFQLDVGSIGMNSIMDDPSNLPSPEEMFPQTAPTPFSKEFWDKVGTGSQQALRQKSTYITGTYEERMGIGVPRRTTISDDNVDYFGEGIYSESEILEKPSVREITERSLDQAGQIIYSTTLYPTEKVDPSYSSTAGERLAQAARTVTNTKSDGLCLRGVNRSLREAYGTSLQGLESAYQAADALRGKPVTVNGKTYTFSSLASKFTEVAGITREGLKKLPAGAIVVWNNNLSGGGKGVSAAGKKHGHISIALGNGKESSDYIGNQITNRDAEYTVFLPT